MPNAVLTQFESSLRCKGLQRPEKSILRCIAFQEVDLTNDLSKGLDDLAQLCQLPRPQTVELVAKLAERGFIRVNGRTLIVAFD